MGKLQLHFKPIGRGSRTLSDSLGLAILGALMVASVGRLNLWELVMLLAPNAYPRRY